MRKAFLVLVLIVLCLAGAGFLTIRIFFPPAKIKSMVTMQVEKVLGRSVQVGNAGISIYPVIGFSLSNVSVSNTLRPGFSQDPFLRFDRLLVQVSVISLIKKQPEIKKIILKKPQIMVEKDKAGSFNFSDLAIMAQDSTKEKKEKKSTGLPVLPVPVSLNLFAIEDGVIIFHDMRARQDIIIGDLDDRIDFSIDRELKNITTKGTLSCSQVSLKTKQLTKPLSNLTVTLAHDIGADLIEGKATIKSLKLSLQKVVLSMAGTVDGLNSKPVFDLAVTSDPILLQDLLREIPPELAPVISQMSAAGELRLGLAVKGALEEKAPLPVSGTVSIHDGYFKNNSLPKAIQQIAMECSFTDNSLDVSSLKVRCGENPIALKLKVSDFKKPVIDLKMLADFNLGEIKDFAALPPGYAFSGKIFADIAAQGKADPADLTGIAVQGKLNLENASFLTPPLVLPAVVNGSFTLSSQAIAQQLAVKIGKSLVKMDANVRNYLTFVFPDSTRKLPRPAINFTVTAPMLDADEFLPPKKEASEEKNESEEKKSVAIAPLPGVDVTGKITASNVIYNKIPMSNVSILISIINDMVNVDVASGFARGTISEKLAADMRNVQNVSFTNALSVKDVEISDMLGNFGGFLSPTTPINRELNKLPQSLFGKITISSGFKGNGGNPDAFIESLKGDVALKMAEGTIKNSLILDRMSGVVEKFLSIHDIKFKDLSTVLKVENRSVLVDQLKLASDAGDWNANGKVGFDAALDLQVSNRMTKSHSEKLLKVQNKGKDILKGLVQNSAIAQAAGEVIDNASVPADNDGRVTLLMKLGGSAADPKASFAGFGKGTTSASQNSSTPKQQVMQKINEKIDNAKAEAQKKLDEERKKAEEFARQKTAEQKQVLEQKKQVIEQKKENVQQEIKKNAVGKLKKMF